MMTRRAVLSVLLLVSAACGARAGGGAASGATSRSSVPTLIVENETGTGYEIFIMFTGTDNGRPLGTAGPLRNTPIQLADIPRNGSVRFRARPMSTAEDRTIYSDPVELADGRQLTWRLDLFRSSEIRSRPNQAE